jgi:restriction endonuclease S subunit
MLYVLDKGISVDRLTVERLENLPLKNPRKKIARRIASISDKASSRNA